MHMTQNQIEKARTERRVGDILRHDRVAFFQHIGETLGYQMVVHNDGLHWKFSKGKYDVNVYPTTFKILTVLNRYNGADYKAHRESPVYCGCTQSIESLLADFTAVVVRALKHPREYLPFGHPKHKTRQT